MSATYFEIEADDDEDDDLDDAGEAGEAGEAEPAGDAPLTEAGLRRLGHSKDHRPDRPQVVIG
ncbi:MAG: hypothetical protein WBP81_09950, partial [Solirubrobacteraceae bacterium]